MTLNRNWNELLPKEEPEFGQSSADDRDKRKEPCDVRPRRYMDVPQAVELWMACLKELGFFPFIPVV